MTQSDPSLLSTSAASLATPATPAARVARAVVNAQTSEDARNRAREGVRDFIAVSLPITYRHFHDDGVDAIAALFGSADPGHLAVRLGYFGHALDFDDYHAGMRGHPSTVILPALFAAYAASRRNTVRDPRRQASSGADAAAPTLDEFLDAYVVGVELAGRVGLALGARHYVGGFHATATAGAIAAAGAVARLLKLSVASVDNALGLAATQATGLRAQFGSSAKPFHAGVTARIGYESAQLAYRGFQGQPGVLAAFIDTLGLGAGAPERLNEGWGAPWRIVEPGLEFKRYPTCGGTHGAADAALGLRTALFEALDFDPARALTSPGDLADIFAARIESAVLSFPPGADVAPYVRVPVSQVEARFSLEYVIATALFDGEVTLDRFADGLVDTRIAAFAARVERRPDLSAPPDAENPDARFHELRLTLKGGQILTRRVTRDEAQKTPSDVAAKLAFSLDLLKSKVNADRVLTSTALTKNEDIGALLDLLDPPIHDAG